MYCHNCGTEAASGAAFCTVCGTDLTGQSASPGSATNSLSTYAPAPPITTASAFGSVKYAPWIRRVLASLIDGVIVTAPSLVLAWYIVLVRGTFHFGTTATYATRMTCSFSNDTIGCSDGTFLHARFGELILGFVVINLLWGVYVVLSVAGKHRGTVGMRTLKIKIALASDATSAVSRSRSLGRYATYLLIGYVGILTRLFGASLTILGWAGLLDSLWPLWDRRKQTLHDKVAGTVALDARR